MPQIFSRRANVISQVSIYGTVFFLAAAILLGMLIVRSPYMTEAGIIREQPVPFSHKHHVGDIGLDCRYCHTGVEDSSFAGLPPTATCIGCHSQIWKDAPMLAPVRESFRTDQPLKWTRVHNLQDFAYFDHSIHIYKGIGCTTCHGEVAEMPLLSRQHSLLMEWCLKCHRNPENYVRPRTEVFATSAEYSPTKHAAAAELIEKYQIHIKTDCYICHR